MIQKIILHDYKTKPLKGYGSRHSLSFWDLGIGRGEMGDGQTVGLKNTGKVKPRELRLLASSNTLELSSGFLGL